MVFHVAIIAQHGTRLAVMARDSHMSLRGITAVSAILRLLRILSYPSNRIALEQELSFSSSLKQGDPGTGMSGSRNFACDSMSTDTVYARQITWEIWLKDALLLFHLSKHVSIWD
jgi:hypothetical protein